MSGFSGREFGRGNVAVRHVAVLVGFQWRLPYSGPELSKHEGQVSAVAVCVI
jgi:hypothetical protein